jgi:hypothetical protein
MLLLRAGKLAAASSRACALLRSGGTGQASFLPPFHRAFPNKLRYFSSKSGGDDNIDGPDDLSYMRSRWADMKHMQEMERTFQPYPHTFKATHTIPEFNAQYQSVGPGERRPEVKVSIAGRVNSIRRSGKSLVFLEIKGDGSKLQVECTKSF